MNGKRLSKVKAKLPQILSDFPSTMDSDIYLIICYWVVNDGLINLIGSEAANKLAAVAFRGKLTTPESITRARRSLNEEGLFLGKKHQIRKAQQTEVRNWARGQSA